MTNKKPSQLDSFASNGTRKLKVENQGLKNKPKTGIFIDGANLYYSQKQNGWKIDLKYFKRILQKEIKIVIFNYYQAIPDKKDPAFLSTQKYVKMIENNATLKTKPLKYIKDDNRTIKKGDVDVEIVLDVVRNIPKLDLIIIVSGDSDFLELRNYILECNKKIIFIGFKRNMAFELKQGKYLQFEKIRKYIEYKRKTPRSYPGRILLPILYQKKHLKSRKKIKQTKLRNY